MADDPPSVLFAVEQLRRRVPGGIGAHARGLLAGFAALSAEGEAVDLTLVASRAPRRTGDDELAAMGWPLCLSRLPGRALTRAWDHRLVHAPPGFDVVHSVSMAAPFPSRGGGGRLVLTVHDLAWRRHPEATTPRGRAGTRAPSPAPGSPVRTSSCRPGWSRRTWWPPASTRI